jgi:Peptidase family M28
MILLSTALLLAAGIDGQAALGHASKLSALGPHKWGSPLNAAAADYVEAQFREVGLQEVRQQTFSSQGLQGSNVIGVLRAPGPEFVLVGAHHDTAPEAPGAYDDGGGVGVLIEAARLLAKSSTHPRTLVFVSFDGEEAWSTGKGTTTGSRAYIEKLGSESRHLVAALVVEMCGWSRGTPVLHPIPYADVLQPGRYGVTPAWLMRAVLQGASDAGAPLGVGDPLIPWLYQPGVRMFRAGLYGDDLSFIQARLPAVFVSDSSLSAFYPWYHQPSDTKDKLSAEALERMGASVLGALSALGGVPRTDALEPQWFIAFGRVIGEPWLWLLAALAVLPGLVLARRAGSVLIGVRLVQALLFALLVWRHPVPALVVLLLPTLMAAVASRGITLIGLVPALALGGVALVGYQRGMLRGTWFQAWEFLALGLALALPFVRPPARVAGRSRSAPKGKRKR